MATISIKDKHLKLDQSKITKAKTILKAKTETEAIERALELVIKTDISTITRIDVMNRILARRNKLMAVKEDVADWVREGREERDKRYGE